MSRHDFRAARQRFLRCFAAFAAAREGSIPVILALLVVVLVVAGGGVADAMRIVSARTALQTSLDGATISVAKDLASLTDTQVSTKLTTWLANANTASDTTVALGTVTVDRTAMSVTATASAVLPTSFLKLIGMKSLTTTVSSQAASASKAYMSVYLLLDNSASMGLAAATADQNTMLAKIGCVFACHTDEGSLYWVGGVAYHTTYDASQALGVTLRRDVMNTAATIGRAHV